MSRKLILSESRKAKVIKFYQDGRSLRQTSRNFGISRPVCKKILLEYEIPIRDKKFGIRKHKFDTEFFKLINNEYRAYWLGFIIADASLCRTKLGIQLQIGDVDHLENLRLHIGSTAPVRKPFRTDKNGLRKQYAAFELCSIDLVADLGNLGVLPNKSLCVPHVDVPIGLEHHYWRGIFDGDGLLSVHNGEWTIGICGSYEIAEAALRYFHKLTGTCAKIHEHGKIYVAQVGGNSQVGLIVESLYNDAHVFLDRKFKRAKKLCKTI